MKNSQNIFITLCCIIFLSCAQNQRYKLMSFFFDEVPDPSKKDKAVFEPVFESSPKDSLKNKLISDTELIVQWVFHPAYQKKECNKCHDRTNSLALIEQQPELCYSCHKEMENKYKLLHGPVAAGFCSECHNPHSSKIEHLLTRKGRRLCTHCHELNDIKKNSSHANINNTNCTKCHNPHGGEKNYYLNKNPVSSQGESKKNGKESS